MANYFLQGVDDGLWRRVRVRAAQDGTSIKASLIRLLTEWVNSPLPDDRLDTRTREE